MYMRKAGIRQGPRGEGRLVVFEVASSTGLSSRNFLANGTFDIKYPIHSQFVQALTPDFQI